ncbi:LytR/AlgR family response regulator transcription factor [Aureicoccus marinus]|jgi:two-component system LytT family response regulator|uniref:DNA-binding response regulator n=1 Tax=Aureicoccus marinus TaxID=754435 RepID=A0A2S7T8B0_9FLAO|nr:LytTR family DNA-binding domain-containing protein [Aureicoccus marinus]PQJ15808.1 DNA-binding response regulator [Aureicoccus marinus]
MKKLKALIVEDETHSREILRNYIGKYCPTVEVMGEADGVESGVNLIKQSPPDLLFLDVEMPFGNAFDLLDQLPDRSFETVFVTAYDHYAKDALNHHAAYYLTKPISIDELVKAVDYVGEVKKQEEAIEGKVLQARLQPVEGKITVPQQDGFEVLSAQEIIYCKADDNYTEIHLKDRKILVSKTLKYFETALDGFSFARIHKSFLVNVNEVSRYRKGKGGSVVLSTGKELSVSASKKAELLQYFQ